MNESGSILELIDRTIRIDREGKFTCKDAGSTFLTLSNLLYHRTSNELQPAASSQESRDTGTVLARGVLHLT